MNTYVIEKKVNPLEYALHINKDFSVIKFAKQNGLTKQCIYGWIHNGFGNGIISYYKYITNKIEVSKYKRELFEGGFVPNNYHEAILLCKELGVSINELI